MNPSAVHLQPFFDWLVRTTVQAGVLVCLILLVQRVLGRWIGVRGRHCLWFLLLIRLALPWAPQSGLSMYNLLPVSWSHAYETRIGREARLVSETRQGVTIEGLGATDSVARDAPQGERASAPQSSGGLSKSRIAILLSLFWLAGAGCLAGCIVVSNIRLGRIIRRGRPVTDRWVLGVLEECRRLMGTRAAVEVIATDKIPCPALCGWVRPRLLMPRKTLAERDRNELRHIFLHELAHLKRHDILIGHLASLLHVLHWFNPLVALGLRRMRLDRELACDGLALSRLRPDETAAYGQTVIRQIERLLASQWRTVVPGLCGDRNQIKERIALVSLFRRERYRRSHLTLVLVGALAIVGLTNGRTVAPMAPGEVLLPAVTWDEYARRDFPTTHQDQHANIQRCCIRNRETGKYLAVDGEQVTCDADEPGEMGLWEYRFDEISNAPDDTVYFYSVTARKYLTSDKEGNLAVDARAPEETAHWTCWPQPAGVWVVSHYFTNGGYLQLNEGGQPRVNWRGTGLPHHWDIHAVWRIKTSDDPASNPQWQREKIPGPD